MTRYLTLMKFTDQGIRTIKEAPKGIEQAIKAFEAMGGKVLGTYMLMGEYDMAVISEAPNDEIGLGFLLSVGARGNVRTKALKAFTLEEFAQILKKMP